MKRLVRLAALVAVIGMSLALCMGSVIAEDQAGDPNPRPQQPADEKPPEATDEKPKDGGMRFGEPPLVPHDAEYRWDPFTDCVEVIVDGSKSQNGLLLHT